MSPFPHKLQMVGPIGRLTKAAVSYKAALYAFIIVPKLAAADRGATFGRKIKTSCTSSFRQWYEDGGRQQIRAQIWNQGEKVDM
jgi:hypothetical protein